MNSSHLCVAEWGSPTTALQLETRLPIAHRPGASYAHDRLWDYAGGHLGFYGWLRVVNRSIEKRVFVGLLDLPDRNWRDDYNDRVDPSEAADIALEETASEFGVDVP